MKDWLRISLLLCTFGFFREMRPSEPFVTEYLAGKWRNITTDQVNKEIYPLGTYAVLAQLVIVFLVTDILRYKPIIVLSACAGIILWSILLWTKSVLELQIGQIFFGTFMASEVAYYTYIYAKVDKDKYQRVTGHTRAAILCGKFIGGVLAQILISTKTMDYRELNYISFGSQVVSLFIALSLPSVHRSLYFYYMESKAIEITVIDAAQQPEETTTVLPDQKLANVNSPKTPIVLATSDNIVAGDKNEAEPKFSWRHATQLLRKHIISAYTNSVVVQWSVWWSLATCGQLQVTWYVQFLWKEIDPNHENFYNGAVEAAVTLLGAAGAFAAGFLNSQRYQRWHLCILTTCSLLMGVLLLCSATTTSVRVAYTMYIIFGIVYFLVITIASASVAENLVEDSFALIFGINMLVALLLQTILTIVVLTDNGFALKPRGQYLAYGGYFIGLALLYAVAEFVQTTKRRFSGSPCAKSSQSASLDTGISSIENS